MKAFDALQSGRLRVPNRIALVATVSNLGAGHAIGDELIAFYAERARGGVGTIITEGLSVHPTSVPTPRVPFAFDPDNVAGFRRLADAIHNEGAVIFGQLWHIGRNSLWSPFQTPWSASGERDPFSGTTPHAMTESEIAEVVDGYRRSAVNLERAGFDGVELHGAHGYLLTQFLSPWSNRRTDRYGGSTENRARIVVEILRAVRSACRDGFVIGLKLSAHEYVDGGLDLAESQAIVRHLMDTGGPDYIGITQSNFSPSLERHVPDMRFPDLPFVHLAAGIREVAGGVPIMAMAKVPDMAQASRLIEEGTADLVGMSRALLADPHLVRKTRDGCRPRPCIYCNVCWDQVHQLRPLACFYGPETGHEIDNPVAPPPAAPAARRTVRVIGGGPAGLEFARVAALRGHRVTLYEAEAETGGRLRQEAGVPGRETVGLAVEWYRHELGAAGVEVLTGRKVDEAMLADFASHDVIVQATGRRPVVQPLEGATRVLSLEDALAQRERLAGPVAIIDEIEDEPVYAAAEALAGAGLAVRIVTRRQQIGRRVPAVNMIGVLRRLDEADVAIDVNVQPVAVENGRLAARHALSGRAKDLGPVATIVRAGPYEATPALDAGGRPLLVIGDAYAPRAVLAVVQEAFRHACRIEQVGAG